MKTSGRRIGLGSAPLGPVHRQDAGPSGNEASADDEPPDGFASFRVVRECGFAHLLLDFKLARLLTGFLRDGFVNVSGHAMFTTQFPGGGIAPKKPAALARAHYGKARTA